MLQATHWKKQRRNLISEANAERQIHQRQGHGHLQEKQDDDQRHLSEDQKEVQSQQVASREEIEKLRHELSQSLVQGAHCWTLYNTSGSGALESSSEIQQERDSLTIRCRSLETEMQRLRDAVSLVELQVAQVLRLRGMLEVQRQTSNTLQADVLRLRAENIRSSRNVERSTDEVAQSQARCNEF